MAAPYLLKRKPDDCERPEKFMEVQAYEKFERETALCGSLPGEGTV